MSAQMVYDFVQDIDVRFQDHPHISSRTYAPVPESDPVRHILAMVNDPLKIEYHDFPQYTFWAQHGKMPVVLFQAINKDAWKKNGCPSIMVLKNLPRFPDKGLGPAAWALSFCKDLFNQRNAVLVVEVVKEDGSSDEISFQVNRTLMSYITGEGQHDLYCATIGKDIRHRSLLVHSLQAVVDMLHEPGTISPDLMPESDPNMELLCMTAEVVESLQSVWGNRLPSHIDNLKTVWEEAKDLTPPEIDQLKAKYGSLDI